MICFLVRRFYFPSNFFFDKSFFSFDKINKHEKSNIIHENIHSNLIKLFDSNPEENVEKIIESFKANIDNKYNSEPKITNFKENEFIELRQIYTKTGIKISLFIHIDSFYIFAIKKYANPNEDSKYKDHEINFVKKYSHRCINKFYGFVKNDKNEIVGLVYEFNSNGSLTDFYKKNEKINDIFVFTILIRVYDGIKYLQSKGLIHRDLKPNNILINHDNIPFISDFETVRSVERESSDKNFTISIGSQYYMSPEQYIGDVISYTTDIYSFGCIIYFLFEKKEPLDIDVKIKNINIPIINNMPPNIQHLYSSCIENNQKERIKLDEIENILKNEINSFFYIEKFLINDFVSVTDELINYFHENILFLLKKDGDLIFYFQNILNSELVSLLDHLKYDNNTNRLLNLGEFYLYGYGEKKDYTKAKKYYELAANQNDSKAQCILGDFYYNGYGVEKDLFEAIYYYEKAANQNNLDALNKLGDIYYFGIYIKSDYTKAITYFEKAAKQNSVHALYYLGSIYLKDEKKDYVKAKKYFEKAAEQNDTSALLSLGIIYYNGYGVEIDYLKAKDYFEKSANQNDSLSLYYLGCFYYYGNGIEKDYLKAKDYFEKSAKKDNDEALYCLGDFYFYGYGVKQDYIKAREYYESSAK